MSLIISIIALGLIIAFHEFGHFIIARFFKVGVIEFSIGMGPKIISLVRHNTRYSLRLLPFGGSCMMLGEEMSEDEYDHGQKLNSLNNGIFEQNSFYSAGDYIRVDGRSFLKSEQFINKPAWQRLCILAAGPLFNFLLAFLFALILTTAYGYDRPIVLDTMDNLALSDIDEGDRILAMAVIEDKDNIHWEKIDTSRDMQLFMIVNDQKLQNKELFGIRYLDMDTGDEKVAMIKPFLDEETGLARLGISYNGGYAPIENVAEIIYYSLYDIKYCIKSAILSIKLLLSGNINRSDIMGPVRIVAVMDETVNMAARVNLFTAVMTLLNLIILLSGTIGAMNLLPIPALDGGRIFFVLIEILTRHAVPKKLEANIHLAGMLLLLCLMILIMFNDVAMLVHG